MENKKYVLTDATTEIEGHILHRIKMANGSEITGGWIESEYNLSQDGNCWVDGNAMVYGNARVTENAYIGDNAMVYGNARVTENAYIGDNARVYDNALIYGKGRVTGYARVYDEASVYGNAEVDGHAEIYGNAKVAEHGRVYGWARVYDNAVVAGDSVVFDAVKIHGRVYIEGNARIADYADLCGDFFICDEVYIGREAVIRSKTDFLFIRNNFSSGRGITWTKSNDMWNTGCFYGTSDELIAKAEQDDAYRRSSTYMLKTYHKAEYFRAIVAMVERFKEIDAMDDEFIKQHDSVLDDAND